MTPLTPEQTEALDVARALASIGVPVFLATPDPSSNTGFRLPGNWQQTKPDPAIVDHWQPGMALALVMGCGLDLVDVDPRSEGNPASLNGATPVSYAAALTPSGGVHSFVRSIGVRSRDNVMPGIDIKAGDSTGKGRGFAFIAPTVRVSKVTGQPAAYRWAQLPDVTRLAAVLRGEIADDSGAGLRKLVEEVRAAAGAKPSAPNPYTGPPYAELPVELQTVVNQWTARAVEGIRAELKASQDWAPGQTDARGRGWEKLQADAALRLGQLARATWNDLDLTEAQAAFMDAAPVDGTWGYEDVALKWTQQHGRLEPAAWPDLRSPAERDAEAWARLGVDPSSVPTFAPAPPTGVPGVPAPGEPENEDAAIAARYFGAGGIQAATLAGDVMALGPLRIGIDHVTWSYEGGVWSSNKKVVENRLTRLLGQRFRTSYTGVAEAFVRANVDTITCEPVSDLVNFRNGLLDWRTGELKPHDPDVPSTVQLPIAYDPTAECPTFERFLTEVLPADVIATAWELIGYLMFSGNPLHKAVMFTGHGRNGKGTFIRVLQAVLGKRNITNVSLHDLVNTRFTTASLFGKLANIAGDIDAGYIENTATFKQITGGDTISAEHKGRDRFDFTPWAVPLFSANKIPASADTTVGYLSRWLVIPFPTSLAGREDRRLEGRLHQVRELQGIAARGIAALPALLDRGDFEPTASGELAREDFIRRVDQVRTWLSDCCSIHPEHPWVPRTVLYNAYKQWAFRDGHKPVRASEFYERLESAGAEPAILHGTRGFKRIAVIDDGVHLGVQNLPQTGPFAPTHLPQPATAVVSAPDLHPHVFAGQPPSFSSQGAEGAETPQPPYARDAQERGWEPPAPSAPSLFETPQAAPAERPPAKRREQTDAARQKAAEKRETKRLEAIAAAAGATIELPAVVTRDGQVHACTHATADALLSTITELTVDVEHTGYPVGHADYALRTIQLGGPGLAVDLDASDPAQVELARRHLARAQVLHAHSATADLIPLAVADVLDIDAGWDRMHDTAILAKLADPASTGNDADLKSLSRAVLGAEGLAYDADQARAALFKAGKWLTETEVTTPVERSGWAQVDPRSETMIRYAAADVLDDAVLAKRLPQPPPEVLVRERTVQRMTARVAYHGLPIDGEHVEAMHAKHTQARAEHAERVTAFGIENPGSPAQVGARMVELDVPLPRTATGKPSVAAAVLERMRNDEGAGGDLARAVLDWRHHDTAMKLFLDPYRELVHRGDGRARPTVYTLGADTGRMSCVRPNLQQVPREGGFRACITADPGHLLASADFAGVELRVAAALSGDANLREILDNPERDLHWEVARIAFGPGATKANRYAVKRGVFGRIYGGGVEAVANGVGVDLSRAQAVIDAMDALTPTLAEWSRMVRDGIRSGRTQFPTAAGRVIHLPKDRPHAGPNYCIQGTARELLVDALLRWRETRWGECVLLPVHDELVVMVPEDEAEDATVALVQCMTSELAGVPIIAEPSQPTYAWSDSV